MTDKQIKLSTYSVNYLWLCAREAPSQQFFATKIPLHYLKRMYANAKFYPQAEFNLWLDFGQLALRERFFLDSHRFAFNSDCIRIRDLRSIPEYRDLPGFASDTNIALYARADCARILVLNHLLLTEQDKLRTIIYSDLDCENVDLDNAKATEALNTHGFVYGKSGRNNICNGYVGIKGEKGKLFMKDYLLPKTLTSFQKNLVNHFGAFIDAVRHYRNTQCPELKYRDLGLIELPLMRSVMPYNTEIYGNVCPPIAARIPGSIEYV